MTDERWTRWHEGRVVFADTDDHARLVARTLGVDAREWGRVLDRYAASVASTDADADARLGALAAAFAASARGGPPSPRAIDDDCPICGKRALAPAVERQSDADTPPSLWARCGECGHGALIAGRATSAVYASADYYRARDAGGAGYDDYAAERAYRERKGGALLARIAALSGRAPASSLLEIGSGYGYTRRAAEERGMGTSGVDRSPHAAARAAALYGHATFTGTLAEALAAPTGRDLVGAFDMVLYQFVLEHLDDPLRELRTAAATLAPGGVLAVLVPSMDALELEVFGASYRSLRHDHLHLFSLESLTRSLVAAGLRPIASSTECSVRSFAGFLSSAELLAIDARRRGADLLVLATKEPP